MKEVVLTQEMKEKLSGCYLILKEECRIVRLGDAIELTPENFKAYLVDDDNVWQELTVDDITWWSEDGSDTDYKYEVKNGSSEYFEHDITPQEVQELLDEVIENRLKAAEKTTNKD